MSGYKAPDWAEAYATARDEIWETDPHYKGFLAALEELNTETDRGMTLVVTSFIDRMLGDIITAFLIDNPSTKILLSSFNAPSGAVLAGEKVDALPSVSKIKMGSER